MRRRKPLSAPFAASLLVLTADTRVRLVARLRTSSWAGRPLGVPPGSALTEAMLGSLDAGVPE